MAAQVRTSMPGELGDLTVREDHYMFEVSRFIEKAMRAKILFGSGSLFYLRLKTIR